MMQTSHLRDFNNISQFGRLHGPWLWSNLWPVLNESGCCDNTQDSFSRSFADALLPARSRDPGSHVESIRSTSPRRPAAMGWPERRGPPSCSCLGFVGETHTHRSCLDLAAGNVVRYLRERPQPSVVRSTPPWDAPSRYSEPHVDGDEPAPPRRTRPER